MASEGKEQPTPSGPQREDSSKRWSFYKTAMAVTTIMAIGVVLAVLGYKVSLSTSSTSAPRPSPPPPLQQSQLSDGRHSHQSSMS